MILTCPACATQYRLKDDAIPPEGRQVRCAACKHKWHEDGAPSAESGTAGQGTVAEKRDDAGMGGGPPQADPHDVAQANADVPPEAAREQMIADTPEPEIPGNEFAPSPRAEPAHSDDGFAAIPAMHDDDEAPRGSWIGWIVGLILVVIAAAAAFYFLAPPELKARAGIAEVGKSPLQLMLTTSDRQQLASGNEMVAITGRVINATDRVQAVPPIHAELRDPTDNRLIYQWTIPAPARSLAPGAAASFNSANADVPKGGDSLSLRFAS